MAGKLLFQTRKLKYFYCRILGTISSVYWHIQIFTLALLSRLYQMAILGWLTVYYLAEAIILTLIPAYFRAEKSLKGKIVLVTGGAGGVGQELAVRMAKQKATVVVWDVNEKALEKLQEKAKAEACKIHCYTVDVADRKNVYKYADIVQSDIGDVEILINNAGIVCGQQFLEVPDYMIEKTFKVNILAHYWTTKAFLPNMINNKKGHIVTIGSLTGLLGTYKCTDYSASKFATVGFHESLLTELKTHGYDKIHMTLICPYFINTGMFDGCKPRNMDMLEPKDVAKRTITAIKRNEVFVTLPAFSRFVLPIKNYLPAKLCWAFLFRLVQGPQSMMDMRNFKEVEAA